MVRLVACFRGQLERLRSEEASTSRSTIKLINNSLQTSLQSFLVISLINLSSKTVSKRNKGIRSVPALHEDLLHDVAYDFYGRRMATCSSDQSVKVWDQASADGTWQNTYTWKPHSGSIWKVAWAHPEFGQILATCSIDRTVNIWEEPESKPAESSERKGWENRACLVDSRESVQDIKFSPPHLGLRLATGSLDGQVRIYEAVDIMNLGHWPLMEEFDASKEGVSCLSWNFARSDPAMIAVGSLDGSVRIWEYSEAARKWQVAEVLSAPSPASSSSSRSNGADGALSGAGAAAAAGALPVHDVAWAPQMGRRYHLIAVAGKDRFVRIYKLTKGAAGKYTAQLIMESAEHGAEVWKVEWNVTGTMLASSGDDGRVRLWKSDLKNKWQAVEQLP